MDIYDDRVSEVLQAIETVKRRKLADKGQHISDYIDPLNHLDKFIIQNNNIIFGRRGCGKTTLLLNGMEKTKDKTTVSLDCQSLRNYTENIILINILTYIVDEIKNEFDDFKNENKVNLWGMLKRDERLASRNMESLSISLDDAHQILSELKKIPDEYNSVQKRNQKSVTKKDTKKDMSFGVRTNNSLKGGAKRGLVDVSSCTSIIGDYKKSVIETESHLDEAQTISEVKRTIKKTDILDEYKHILISLINEYKKITNNDVVLLLDDFYQIKIINQVRIVQYLHDISKDCINSSFCFKICTLPNRLKINYEDENFLSYSDDFTVMKLDKNLSDFSGLKDYLLQILCATIFNRKITPREIEELFTKGTLNLLIVASGGVPRDFLIMFSKSVLQAKAMSESKITKPQIYYVIRDMREDKDTNITFDEDVTEQMIANMLEDITQQIIKNNNTNVFLLNNETDDDIKRIMRNLVNARYLHIIKEATSSEKVKKQSFTAYLIDMSFYISGKQLKKGFNSRKFWISDSKKRYKELDSAPIFKPIFKPSIQ